VRHDLYINMKEYSMSDAQMLCDMTHMNDHYGVATMSRLLTIIVLGSLWQNIVSFKGLFCKRDL